MLKYLSKTILILSALALALAGCGGGNEDSFQTLSLSTTLATGSVECPFSGVSVSSGEDRNENSVLDVGEITSTNVSCNPEGSAIILNDDIQSFFGADPSLDDTDGDGLSDVFEILNANAIYSPNNADTDNDGVSDDQDDHDGDGLNALQEAENKTSVFVADTDLDGLLDGDEVNNLRTDPLNNDTDGDALLDGEEVFTTFTNPLIVDSDANGIADNDESYSTVVEAPTNISLSIEGLGNISKSVRVNEFSELSIFNNNAGQTGKAIDILLGPDVEDFETAELTFEFDPNEEGSENLRVFNYDDGLGFWVPAEDINDQTVDVISGRVTAELEHFSIYALMNYLSWADQWSSQTDFCIPENESESVSSNVALVLDTSGSLARTDPNNLRSQGAISFLSALSDMDQAAVIDFDSSARLVQGLTDNISALTTALNSLDQRGNTNIGAGVRLGLDVLSVSDTSTNKVMVLFSDGQGSYDNSLTARAINENVRIFTIGLGTGADNTLLSNIAEQTSGAFIAVTNAENLVSAFTALQSTVSDDGTDTDGDGLTDCQEVNGMLGAANAKRYFSDPMNEDTDGDGLLDSEEVGPRTRLSLIDEILGNAAIHPVYSDPSVADTDGDGLSDREEFQNGGSPFVLDTDNDGLSDLDEVGLGLNVSAFDTDDDSPDPSFLNNIFYETDLNDRFEHLNRDRGFDPLFFTEQKSLPEYSTEYLCGLVVGDFKEIDTIPELAGQISSGLVFLGDARDFLANSVQGDAVGAGISLVGLIPLGGDAVKSGAAYVKFVARNPSKAGEALGFILRSTPESTAIATLRAIDEPLIDGLKAANMSDAAILRIARNGAGPNTIENLGAALRRPNVSAISNSRFYADTETVKGWRLAEEDLRLARQGDNVRPSGLDSTVGTNARTRKRFPDAMFPALDGAMVIAESKAGFVRYNKRIITQIRKDVDLRRTGEVDRIQWNFFASDISSSIGADPRILDLLQTEGIEVIFHLP